MSTIDYRATYSSYWTRPDRWGESSFADPESLAAEIIGSCAPASMLDVGCGMGKLVHALLGQGIDAHGCDISDTVINHLAAEHCGRFHQGSILSLPFPDAAFSTVICTDVLEHLAPEDVPKAIAELRRVSRQHLFVVVGTLADRDGSWHLTIQPEEWWITTFLCAGFRRHPRWFDVISYGENKAPNARILLECMNLEMASADHLQWLLEERNLHMDMLREAGRRADAHVIRYHLAAGLLRPGDTVADLACGYGYGAHVLTAHANCARVIGLDASERAITYATRHYGGTRTEFQTCDLDGRLPFADASIDLIASFETLEHISNPTGLLKEIHRVLKPSGRLIASIPNDWTDDSGRDPNPEHLHVYTWDRLQREVAQELIVERAWSQMAGGGMKHHDAARSLQEHPIETASSYPAEWWLVAGIKDPMEGAGIAFQETSFPCRDPLPNPIAHAKTWGNPWLHPGLAWIGHRLANAERLSELALRVIADPKGHPLDRGAALCVVAYQSLKGNPSPGLLSLIQDYTSLKPSDPEALRWNISLAFVHGLLLLRTGERDKAEQILERIAHTDPSPFSPLLATKTVEAAHLSGRLALLGHHQAHAQLLLRQGISAAIGAMSKAGDWNAIGDPALPLPFAWRELAQVADAAQRCTDLLWEIERRPELEYGLQIRTSLKDETNQLQSRITSLQKSEQDQIALYAIVLDRDSMLHASGIEIGRLNTVVSAKDSGLLTQADEIHRLETTVADKQTAIAGQAEKIEQLAGILVAKDSGLLAQADEIHRLEATVTGKQTAIAAQAENIEQLAGILVAKDSGLLAQADEIHRLEATVTDKQTAIAAQAENIEQLAGILVAKDSGLLAQADEIHRLEATVTDKQTAIAAQAENIEQLAGILVAKDSGLLVQSDEIHRLESVVVLKDTAIRSQGGEIHRLHEVVSAMSAEDTKKSAEIQKLNSGIANDEQVIAELNIRTASLDAFVATLDQSLAQHVVWMKERNDQLGQLRCETADLTSKIGDAYQRINEASDRASLLSQQLGELRARPFIRMYEAWRGKWTLKTPLTLTKCAILSALPRRVHAPIKILLGRRTKTANTNMGYRVKLPPPPPADAPVVVHAIGNFWTGGSSRLVVDLIEALGNRYHHKVITSAISPVPAYIGINPILASGIPSVDEAVGILLQSSATALHLHYWGECDEPWYAAFALAAARMGLPIIENVNTPVAPLRITGVTEMVLVSRYVQTNFADGQGLVIYPGSDFDRFSGNPDHASQQDSVGMVYRLEDDKLGSEAIAPFIELARIRPQTKIYIVGGGSLLEPFKQRVAIAGVSTSFAFTDYVAYENLPGWYRRFGIFVAPVRKESFGQVGPFAMSMGIPVVGYDVGAIPEIVNDPTLIAPPGDAVALARLIAALLDDRARRLAVGLMQQRRAHEHFSLQSMIQSYAELYARLIADAAKAGGK